MNSEMNTYDVTIKEYKIQIEKLSSEMKDIKKVYFAQKRRSLLERQAHNKASDTQSGASNGSHQLSSMKSSLSKLNFTESISSTRLIN